MDQLLVKQVTDFLISKLSPSFILIFGSYAKGGIHANSDIDIAYYSQEKKAEAYELFMYAQELAELLKTDVDLVNIEEASTVFQAQIFSSGQVIYCSDSNTLMEREMQAFSMYAKLNEERLPILQSIEESGTIYEE